MLLAGVAQSSAAPQIASFLVRELDASLTVAGALGLPGVHLLPAGLALLAGLGLLSLAVRRRSSSC